MVPVPPAVALDELDRQIAHALQIDGRAAFSEIAAVLGASDRTVARRYQKLRSTGLLRVVGLPHAAALGQVDWMVRMRCTPEAAVPVAGALARREDTSWVSILSGGTEINCVTRTRTQSGEGDLLLQKLPRTQRVTAVTAHCILRAVAGTSGWRGRTAALTPDQERALTPAARRAPKPVLAEADRQLLTALAKDGRAGIPALAAATGWSETTVRRRLSELRDSGVLYFDVEVGPAVLGYAAEATMWLTVAPARLAAVSRELAGHAQIGYAAATTGSANLVAFVICHDLDELYEYLAGGIGGLDGVTGVETAPVVRRVKDAGTLLLP